MTKAKYSGNRDINRRNALKRLGLAAGAAYMAPSILTLSAAHASDGGSGGGGGSGGSGGGGSGGGGDSSGGGSGGASSTSMASRGTSTPSSPSSASGDDGFSGDPTPAGSNLTPEEELRMIQNGWQKAGGK